MGLQPIPNDEKSLAHRRLERSQERNDLQRLERSGEELK
jgi:hypothetical protein